MNRTLTFVVAGVILAGSAGDALAVGGNPGNTVCKSVAYDCDKPLAFMPLPIGNYCATSSISLGKQGDILMIEGDQAMVMFNPKTQRAVACDNNNGGKCQNGPAFITMGENEDGSTHTLVVPGDKALVISGRPGDIFAKAMVNAKSLIEVITTPVTEKCDVLLKGLKDEAEKTGFQPPDVDTVELDGVKIPAKDSTFVFDGNRAIVVHKYANPPQGFAEKLIPGIGVVTLGESKETSKVLFKPFPAILGGYIDILDLAAGPSNDQSVTAILSLSKEKPAKTVDIYSCNVPLDEPSPVTCEIQSSGANGDKATETAILKPKLKELAREGTGNEDLGAGLADALIDKSFLGFPKVLMHKIEGYNDVPNAIFFDQTGGHIYRLNPDKTVTVSTDDVLPSADLCLLADLDNYGGKDLVCFVENAFFFVPKRNLDPVIGDITVGPQLGSTVKTQEDEDLTYKWSVYEMKDGALVDHSDLLSNPTAANPALNLSLDEVASAKVVHVVAEDLPNININATLTKAIKSVGVKDAAGVPEGGYFAVLTVKDAGGMSDTAIVPLPTKGVGLGATTPPASTPPVNVSPAAPNFGLFGGCSTLPNAPSSNFVWILVIPAFMARILRKRFP